MPLKSRWNPKHSVPIDKSCKEGEPTNQPRVFCHHDSNIDKLLVHMHTIQRTGDRDIQQNIDRYLMICYDTQFQSMLLPKNSVPHYYNLPDIFLYVVGILDPHMDTDQSLQQVLLLLRQCIPLRRRTKRAQREVQWTDDNLFSMQTLVRCMQGMLLGLYPTSLNAVAFHARIGIQVFLRTLLVQSFPVLHAAIQHIGYILKLAIMEHLCNTITDFYPGISHTLNQSGQKIEHFCNSVSTICDIFRGELNSLFCAQMNAHHHQNLPPRFQPALFMAIIPQLNKIAHSYFERCTRAYRGIIIGANVQYKHVDLAKKMLTPSILSRLGVLWENMYFTSNQNVFERVHAPLLSPDMLVFAWHLTKILNVHPLPPCIMQHQLQALSLRYGGDMSCIQKCRMLHVCVVCIIRRGSAHGMRLRHDCQTGLLSCINCEKGTILTIDTLGRIVCIGNDRIVLSCCCASFIHYGGSGLDFCTKCGLQCTHQRQLFKKKEKHFYMKHFHNVFDEVSAAADGDGIHDKRRKCKNVKFKFQCEKSQMCSQPNKNKQSKKNAHAFSFWKQFTNLKADDNAKYVPPHCVLCAQKNVHQHLSLLHVQHRCMVNSYLCSKHMIPQHISKSILHHDHLFAYFAINAMHHKRGGGSNSLFVVMDQQHADARQNFFDENMENALLQRKGRRGRKPKYLAKYLLTKKMLQQQTSSSSS